VAHGGRFRVSTVVLEDRVEVEVLTAASLPCASRSAATKNLASTASVRACTFEKRHSLPLPVVQILSS